MGLLQLIMQQAASQIPTDGWYGPGFDKMVADYRAGVDAAPAVATPPIAPATETPAPTSKPKRRGLLGAIAGAFSPEPGSWWHSALTNPDGIWGARGGQVAYERSERDRATTEQMDQAKLAEQRAKASKAERGNETQVVGNNVLVTGPDGKPQWMTPPDAPDKTMKLIDLWSKTPDGPLRKLIERAISGYQYSPEYIEAKGADTRRTVTTRAKATAANRAPTATKGDIPSGWQVVK